jgi:hypothetical protein
MGNFFVLMSLIPDGAFFLHPETQNPRLHRIFRFYDLGIHAFFLFLLFLFTREAVQIHSRNRGAHFLRDRV